MRRDLSWGSKHESTSNRAGKVWKGLGTHDPTSSREEFYRSSLWNSHYVRRYLPRYLPIQLWRLSSTWGRPGSPRSKRESASKPQNEPQASAEEDWYARWEKQKLEQYDDFVKRVEQDPFKALFGNSWLKWDGMEPEPANPLQGNDFLGRARILHRKASKPENSIDKTSDNKDAGSGGPKGETISNQSIAEQYDIDPITNRKVLKRNPAKKDSETFDIHVQSFRTPITGSPGDHAPKSSPSINNQASKPQPAQSEYDSSPRAGSPISQYRSNGVSPSKNCNLGTSRERQPTVSDGPKSTNENNWLAQEGFGHRQGDRWDSQPLQTPRAKPKNFAPKIESALDHHLLRKSGNGRASDLPATQDMLEQKNIEDTDMHRSNDIRPLEGTPSEGAKEGEVEKQIRQRKLLEEHESRHLDREKELAQEIATDRPEGRIYNGVGGNRQLRGLRFGSWLKSSSRDDATWNCKISDIGAPDTIPNRQITTSRTSFECEPKRAKWESVAPIKAGPKALAVIGDKYRKLRSQIVPFKARLDAMKADYEALRQRWLEERRREKEKAAKKANEMLEKEVMAQRLAMETMEMRSKEQPSNKSKIIPPDAELDGDRKRRQPACRKLQSFLPGEGDVASNVHEFVGNDRWYKQKAPHTLDAKDVKLHTKVRKATGDRALIREIRNIYEEAYGTIDTKHRQPSQSNDVSRGPLTLGGQKPTTEKPAPPSESTTSSSPNNASPAPHSQRFDGSQCGDALAIVQKLFAQLREVQTMIQDHHSQLEEVASKVTDPDATTLQASNAYEQIVMQIFMASMKLARTSTPGARLLPLSLPKSNISGTFASVQSKQPKTTRPLSTTLAKSTNVAIQKAKSLSKYRILAYDPQMQKLTTAKAVTPVPISKEEALSPVDALNRVKNPGIFLPHVTSLSEKGYEPVSGSSNVLVFKKQVDEDELSRIKREDQSQEPNSIDEMIYPYAKPVWPISVWNAGARCLYSPEELEELRERFIQKLVEEESKKERLEEVKKQQAEEFPGEQLKQEKVDGDQGPQSTSSASADTSSSGKVRREEVVFSGRPRGNWRNTSAKKAKSKGKGAARRMKTIKRMFAVGVFTAGCCYAVGVVSEMMPK